jgi:hypothetical protein
MAAPTKNSAPIITLSRALTGKAGNSKPTIAPGQSQQTAPATAKTMARILIAIAYTAHSQARGAVAGELSANAAHGVPRTTNEDKRRAVLTLLNGKRPPTEVALAFHVLCMFG